MKQSHKVHMVPTDKPSILVYNNIKQGLFIGKGLGDGILAKHRTGDCTNQHLYFTSDEEIKDNWVLHTTLNVIAKISTTKEWTDGKGKIYGPIIDPYKHNWRKIVATTNKELWGELIKTQPWPKRTAGIPIIPQSFIEEYARRKGDIEEVMLDVEEKRIGDEHDEFFWKQLKLNSSGEVIWSLKEEKVYTKADLRGIAWAVWDQWCPYFTDKAKRQAFHKWFNENYPE